MKPLHRAVMGGGFGALAIGVIAGSAAFACTPFAQVTLSNNQSSIVTPGSSVTVEGRRFHPDYGPVNFSWKTNTGVVLGSSSASVPVTTTNGSTSSTSDAWVATVTIPTTAVDGEYAIVGWQLHDGVLVGNASAPVFVTGNPAKPADKVVTPPAGTAPATLGASTPAYGSRSSAGAGTPAPAPAAATAAATASQTATAGAPAAPSGVANPSGGAVATPAPGTSAAAQADLLDPSKPLNAPAPDEIWSGIGSPASALSLLDAPAPASSGGGIPAGAVLLGLGTLALAGTALVAGREKVLVRARR